MVLHICVCCVLFCAAGAGPGGAGAGGAGPGRAARGCVGVGQHVQGAIECRSLTGLFLGRLTGGARCGGGGAPWWGEGRAPHQDSCIEARLLQHACAEACSLCGVNVVGCAWVGMLLAVAAFWLQLRRAGPGRHGPRMRRRKQNRSGRGHILRRKFARQQLKMRLRAARAG